jgi:hypothetical protein
MEPIPNNLKMGLSTRRIAHKDQLRRRNSDVTKKDGSSAGHLNPEQA